MLLSLNQVLMIVNNFQPLIKSVINYKFVFYESLFSYISINILQIDI